MKSIFTLVIIFVAVTTAKKVANKSKQKGSRDGTGSESDEDDNIISKESVSLIKSTSFDLRGTVRLRYGIEAIIEKQGINFVCSPLTALFPLAKLIFGTNKGSSRDEIESALGIKRKSVKRKFKTYIRELRHVPGVISIIANRIYVNESIEIIKTYKNRVKKVFQSGIVKINYDKAEKSSNKINQWLKDQSRGYMKKILNPSEIEPNTSIIIINAVYFRGFWKESFSDPFLYDFHSPISVQKILMMRQISFCNYVESGALGAQIVEIPFAEKKSSIVVVLPRSKTGLAGVLSILQTNPELINDEMKLMNRTYLKITLPTFDVRSVVDLKEMYEKMGVTAIFNNGSLESLTNDTQVYVSKALQKTYIQVTEISYLRTPSTTAKPSSSSLVANQTATNFTAEHPFMFYIKAGQHQIIAGIFNAEKQKKI